MAQAPFTFAQNWSRLGATVQGWFRFGGSSCIGLSIGTSSIKLVELMPGKKGWKLLHFGVIQLPEDVILNREITNSISIVESLKTLMGELKLKSKEVCTALSGTSVIVKRMTLEAPNLRELQDQVFWEAEQYLPFDVSEVVMDYHLLSRSKENQADVILVAVKKAVLDSYMGAIEDADLQPKIVDLDYFALQNLVEANYPVNAQEAVAVVDLGAAAMKLVVVHGGVPVFTKDTAMGGNNLTAEIQKQLNLSFRDAELLKVGGTSQGLPQEVNDLMNIAAENFGTEIKRALDFYNASSSGAQVTSVLLTGGSAKISQISRLVEEKVGLPTQVLNPFHSISYDPQVFTQEYIQAIAPIAAIPIGLALRAGARA